MVIAGKATVRSVTVGTRRDHGRKAQENLARLFARNVRLYTCGDSSSVSRVEADGLLRSTLFAFGIDADGGLDEHAVSVLAVDNIAEAYRVALGRLDERVAATMGLWHRVCAAMPPFQSIALWDTLDSIRHLPEVYDTRFAAHEIPCDIDYQLQEPVPDTYLGIDYVHEWLMRLYGEAVRLGRYDFEEACRMLEARCPDYRGLLVNLLDILERGNR